MTFKALLATKAGKTVSTEVVDFDEADLMPGEVSVAIGTAGYTAMLSVLALEHGGISTETGDVLVTGANGGVGSIAISVLSKLGYRVIASTGRPTDGDNLREFGAADVIDRRTLSEPGSSIAKER